MHVGFKVELPGLQVSISLNLLHFYGGKLH